MEGGWEEVQNDGGIVKQERDNGGEPCFQWLGAISEAQGRREGFFLDEVSAPLIRHDSLPPSQHPFPPSLQSTVAVFLLLSPPIPLRSSELFFPPSLCLTTIYIFPLVNEIP